MRKSLFLISSVSLTKMLAKCVSMIFYAPFRRNTYSLCNTDLFWGSINCLIFETNALENV